MWQVAMGRVDMGSVDVPAAPAAPAGVKEWVFHGIDEQRRAAITGALP